jgi:hypothetical protein
MIVVWVCYVCPVRIVCVSDDVIVVCSVERMLYCIVCNPFRCFVLWFKDFEVLCVHVVVCIV